MSITVRTSEASRAATSLLRTNRFATIAQFVRRVELPTRYRVVWQDQQVLWNQVGGVLMKTLVTSLGILALAGLMAACGPDMNAINQATQRAESDAQRASAAATSAEAASAQAQDAAKKADEEAAGAQEAVSRANDAVARLEAAFSSSVTK